MKTKKNFEKNAWIPMKIVPYMPPWFFFGCHYVSFVFIGVHYVFIVFSGFHIFFWCPWLFSCVVQSVSFEFLWFSAFFICFSLVFSNCSLVFHWCPFVFHRFSFVFLWFPLVLLLFLINVSLVFWLWFCFWLVFIVFVFSCVRIALGFLWSFFGVHWFLSDVHLFFFDVQLFFFAFNCFSLGGSLVFSGCWNLQTSNE